MRTVAATPCSLTGCRGPRVRMIGAVDGRPIGVFDSGVGGLTVLHELLVTLPHEDVVYLGDNARLPYGPRPLAEISLGKVLMQLFRASRRFNVQLQPQLTLLQKTLLNVEGLGRQLDPTLDLWVTAKPFLERWMENRIGLAAVRRRFLAEAPYLAAALPELPRLLHQRLDAPPVRSDPAILLLASTQRSTNRLLAIIAVLLLGLVGFIGALLLGVTLP